MKANANLDVTLSEDNHSLDEVVVVGYGNMKKRDLTGAISSVKGSEVALAGVASAAHALAGKAAGLYVRQNSAQPGGGLDILVRGAGSVNANNDPPLCCRRISYCKDRSASRCERSYESRNTRCA